MGTISGFSVPVEGAILPGSAVGEHAVPGNIAPGDTLLAVLHLTEGPVAAVDVTAEFSISATKAGTIENTTTDFTGDHLYAVWAKAS